MGHTQVDKRLESLMFWVEEARKFLESNPWKRRDNCSRMMSIWLMFGFLPSPLFQRYYKTHTTLRKLHLEKTFLKCPKWGMSILRLILPASPTGWQVRGVSFLHSGEQSMLPHLQRVNWILFQDRDCPNSVLGSAIDQQQCHSLSPAHHDLHPDSIQRQH